MSVFSKYDASSVAFEAAHHQHQMFLVLMVLIVAVVFGMVLVLRKAKVAREEGAQEERELSKAREALHRRVEAEELESVRQSVRSKRSVAPTEVPDVTEVKPVTQSYASSPRPSPSRGLPPPPSPEEGIDPERGYIPE